jgi:hypothetical protein
MSFSPRLASHQENTEEESARQAPYMLHQELKHAQLVHRSLTSSGSNVLTGLSRCITQKCFTHSIGIRPINYLSSASSGNRTEALRKFPNPPSAQCFFMRLQLEDKLTTQLNSLREEHAPGEHP